MGVLQAPRFYGDAVLSSCLEGHRILAGGGDPPETVGRIQQALIDLGHALALDGDFGPGTAAAVHDFKVSRGIVPDDGVVGLQTMAALDAAFAHELFDLKAAELAGGPFDLGPRIGDRSDIDATLATCEYAAGTIVELGKLLTFAVPTAIGAGWEAAGGLLGSAGIPIADPHLRDDGAIAQDFAATTVVTGGAGFVLVPPEVREVLDWTDIGSPTGPAEPSADGSMVTPCSAGAVVETTEGTAVPLPQPVVDAWLPVADQLGSPVGPGFADTDVSALFPFTGGMLAFGVDGSVVAAARVGAAGRRFFLPADPTRHLQPPVSGSGVEHLIGGPAALARMADDIAGATAPGDFVYIASWNCELDLPLPRTGGSTTVRQLLTNTVAGGGQVRMHLWAGDPTSGLPPSVTRPLANPLWFAATFVVPLMPQFAHNLAAVSVVDALAGDAAAIRDDRYLMFGSHHQKIVVVSAGGRLVAYVGGIEVTADRLSPVSKGAPLFDVSVRLTGPAAVEVLRTFIERWEAHPAVHGAPLLGNAALGGPTPATGHVTVQITHTYGRGFPYPAPVQTAAAARAQALHQAKTFFYLEDQYAVGSTAQGAAMRKALGAGAVGIVVLAAEDSVDDLPDVGFRRRKFLGRLVGDFPGRFLVFERLGSGSTIGPGAYVHAKLLVVDDEVAVVGSVNSNRRSWSHDSEADAVFVDDDGPGDPLDPATWGAPRRLRTDLWAAHLGIPAAGLGEPRVGLTAFAAVAAGVPGLATLRAYDALTAAPRFVPPLTPPLLVPLLPGLLDFAWDTAEDPPG